VKERPLQHSQVAIPSLSLNAFEFRFFQKK